MNTVNPKVFGKVVVLMGGTSAEREISLLSGANVLQALQQIGINAYKLDVQGDVVEQLQAQQPERAFSILHGGDGENGVIQNILEKLHIPYTGSTPAACQLIMDKPRFNEHIHAQGLPNIRFLVRTELTDPDKIIAEFGLPLCVKPAHGGSSLGVSKVIEKEQLHSAFAIAKNFYPQVLLAPWISGPELTVGILDGKPLAPIEIRTKRTFYDYQAKYIDEDTEYLCPAPLTPAQTQQIKDIAVNVYQAVGARHWARVDFKQDAQGNFWVLEVNPAPGMTTHSLVPLAAKNAGMSFNDLVVKILSLTL